jgi:hypothetical protein
LAVDSAGVRALFADPPRQYSSGPLWVWNDMLTEEQIRSTLRDLAGQKVKQAFVHPRPGLMTPYLSDDWFRLWKVALDEAERLDMNIWIYDENSYPSGFAGGLVPEAMPESRGRGLTFRGQTDPQWDDQTALLYRLAGDGYENVTQQARSREALPQGKYLVANWQLAQSSGWFGGKYYVDLLKPGVTEKFIQITFDAYAEQVGDQFGRRIPGIFTDEPHLWSWGGVHWNEQLREAFQKRWQYDMEDHFPALVRPLGDWRRVRHNYQQLLLEQFIQHWGKPCYEWCERHGLEFTGHYWEHGWPGASHGPDNMAMYAWHQRPAIDNLMNDYSEGVHGQFGNSRTVKELASVANQLGRKRTLCEAYGAGGWDLRFEDMKRIGDWLYVLGVNTLNEHLSYITIRGARKRDHPQSFSYHEPWWDSYHVMAQYFTRLSLVLSEGEQINKILVIEPTTTAWLYQPDSSHRQQLETLGQSFQDLINRLEAAQVEYDVGSEDIIARHGSVRGGELTVGERQYATVVLPPMTENLNAPTVQLLEEYVKAGGRVLCCGDPPPLVDGRPSQRGMEAARSTSWSRVDPTELPQTLLKVADDGFLVRREGDQGMLFHHRRHFEDGQMLFVVNTSIEEPCVCMIQSPLNQMETWDLRTGNIVRRPATTGGTRLKLRLPPCGSTLLFLRDGRPSKPIEPGPRTAGSGPSSRPVKAKSPLQIRRLGPNVLTLDYVDIKAGAQTKENVYFYQANQMAFAANGLQRNPWDSAVQLRDEFIRKTFPAESGFDAAYRFTIEDRVPERLRIVIERPDLYSITCNGTPVAAAEGQWWLDKSFGKIDISSAAKVGENSVAIHASPFTVYHELEPAYVIGDFALRPVDAGFTIVPDRPLELGPWNQQGHPLYGAGVAYAQMFEIYEPTTGRYFVHLPAWYGSAAKVSVNGKTAGHVAWQPWHCDVTDLIRSGENTIEVEVIGTLKNTLGPHHGSPQLGKAWPHAFRQAPENGPPPGDQYHTVGYGLFEPFVLEQMTD